MQACGFSLRCGCAKRGSVDAGARAPGPARPARWASAPASSRAPAGGCAARARCGCRPRRGFCERVVAGGDEALLAARRRPRRCRRGRRRRARPAGCGTERRDRRSRACFAAAQDRGARRDLGLPAVDRDLDHVGSLGSAAHRTSTAPSLADVQADAALDALVLVDRRGACLRSPVIASVGQTFTQAVQPVHVVGDRVADERLADPGRAALVADVGLVLVAEVAQRARAPGSARGLPEPAERAVGQHRAAGPRAARGRPRAPRRALMRVEDARAGATQPLAARRALAARLVARGSRRSSGRRRPCRSGRP